MHKDTFFRKKQSINCGGKYLDLTEPKVMGILNVTPDSFYDGGKYQTQEAVKVKVNELLTEGADIIDVGAYSSRPGASHISAEEEMKRLGNALQTIRTDFPEIIVSVDTFRADIAQRAVKDYGVNLVNDIAGGLMDKDMFKTMLEMQVPYILMHMPGTPQDMQKKSNYKDIIKEIIVILGTTAEQLKKEGLNDIIIDPGFGFGKTLDQNYQLLAHLRAFQVLELPLLVGISRKSMVYKFLDTTSEGALTGSTVLHTLALERGANILRVHDVKEAKQAIQLFLKMRSEGEKYTEHAGN